MLGVGGPSPRSNGSGLCSIGLGGRLAWPWDPGLVPPPMHPPNRALQLRPHRSEVIAFGDQCSLAVQLNAIRWAEIGPRSGGFAVTNSHVFL